MEMSSLLIINLWQRVENYTSTNVPKLAVISHTQQSSHLTDTNTHTAKIYRSHAGSVGADLS